jgi:hypothetical protein
MRVPGRGVGIHCSPGIPAAKWYVAGDSSVRRWSNYGIWILAEDERTGQSLAASVHPHHVSSVATPRYHQPKTQSLADRQSSSTLGVAADYRRTPNSVNAIRRKFAKPKTNEHDAQVLMLRYLWEQYMRFSRCFLTCARPRGTFRNTVIHEIVDFLEEYAEKIAQHPSLRVVLM